MIGDKQANHLNLECDSIDQIDPSHPQSIGGSL
jgi:hypothetical protein